ncbi:hypothetical protein M3Y97_00944800 [Aphelenchoides bicaudatus]|nr:hypothetical protein M3Y97_00944800 [Aphelenchoides bicaudatus]
MLQVDTNVIVIGNGPAGVALSTFLSGWHPFYNASQPHPDELIHERLSGTSSLLLDSVLDHWSDEYEQRNPNVGFYSDLFDRLMRPEPVDSYAARAQKCLDYKHSPTFSIPHMVLGDTQVGGSWNNYDDNMETVSLSNWMDLPVYSLADWLGGQPLLARLPAGIIREYMHAYVKHLDLTDNFKEYTTVTNITKFCCDLTQMIYWRVQGHYSNGLPFEFTCKRVVLACGRKRHRTLEVEGELQAPNLVYNVRAMKQLLSEQKDQAKLDPLNAKRPVIVVGDGISAADAITHCLAEGIQVLHVFRRTEKQLKSTMLSRLSSTVYPEYSKIFDLMLERNEHPCYRRAASTSVTALHPDSTATISHATPNNKREEEQVAYRCMVICVGLQTELTMLEDKHEFDANYQSRLDASLYAIGSVVGDHFIRYLIGGAFRVAQQLIRQELMSGYCYLQLQQAVANKTPIQCLDCHLQELKSLDNSVDPTVTDNSIVDANNNGKLEIVQKRPRRCFFPKIFCRLLS